MRLRGAWSLIVCTLGDLNGRICKTRAMDETWPVAPELLLRPFRLDDADALREFTDDPVGWIERRTEHLPAHGYTYWAVTDAQSLEVVGFCGLLHRPDRGTTLGCATAKHAQGRGILAVVSQAEVWWAAFGDPSTRNPGYRRPRRRGLTRSVQPIPHLDLDRVSGQPATSDSRSMSDADGHPRRAAGRPRRPEVLAGRRSRLAGPPPR